jgi:tetratricopeptide (TPR) repeat protein
MALTADASLTERKWAYNGLSWERRMAGEFRDASAMSRRALQIDPEMVPAFNNMAYAEDLLGHEQAAADLYSRVLSLAPGDEYDPVVTAANRCNLLTASARLLKDPVKMQQGVDCLQQAPPSYRQFAASNAADLALLRHDLAPALAYQPPANASISPQEIAYGAAFLRLSAERIKGSSPALALAVPAFADASARLSAADVYYRAAAPMADWPYQADALSMLARHADAAALISRTPRDCYDCVRIRGLVAMRMGNPAAAQRWFQEAAKQGPGLSRAFLDWGRLLLDNRRYGSAEVKLREAARLSPNWGDPLKYWGDLLAAQGRRNDALQKYDAALKLSPKWDELRQARARLLAAR